jgi:transcriptional regulator with XRE-family HTH domain
VEVYALKSDSSRLFNAVRLGMDIRKTFGLVLRRVRKEKKLSQEKLALESDTNRTYISDLENGVYQPSISTIFALAKILDYRPGELINMVEDELKKEEAS